MLYFYRCKEKKQKHYYWPKPLMIIYDMDSDII